MPIAQSLRVRVLVWVSVALIALFAVTVLALDAVFRQSTEEAMRELLQAQVLGLIALAEPDGRGQLSLPEDAINPQFAVADSGLYGFLWDADGFAVWQSNSLLEREVMAPDLPSPGVQRYVTIEQRGVPPLEALLMGIAWEFSNGRVEPFVFASAVSRAPYAERERAFRNNLIAWFAGITITMLVVLTGLLAWVMRPLRQLARQVRAVERGEQRDIGGSYPSELRRLAGNLNALIDSERRRLVRYRHTLDDLAHSLKTPLAAMRSLLSERGNTEAHELEHELDKMDQRVSYQLRRARASGATGLGLAPVRVQPLVEDLMRTLDKVYREKQVRCELSVDSNAVFRGDTGDLTEILGNLLDNAYKYCDAHVEAEIAMPGGRLVVRVDDDGAGIDSESAEALMERGTRADESIPGHGIGLAVVRETVALYDGTLSIDASPLGGTRVTVTLPPDRYQ